MKFPRFEAHKLFSWLAVALILIIAASTVIPFSSPAGAAAKGKLVLAWHAGFASRWLDPQEHDGTATPDNFLTAIHDALIKNQGTALYDHPALAERFAVAADSKSATFTLRKGVKFHNGDPVTPEDVKFSFERYKGGGATALKARVAAVEIVDAHRVRFRLKQPWPDFMTFYGTPATSAAWIVPKKYLERVGDEGFKKAPVGAGPYRFVSFNPGVELILEAFDGYWRKVPSVKRIVLKSVPDESTRLVRLKRGETDIAYGLRGPDAEEVKRTPGLTLKVILPTVSQWVVFTQQWDPKSPWADRRVRLAANLAIDRKGFSDAEYLGF